MKIKVFVGLLILSLIAVPLFATACEEEVTPPAEEEEEEEEEEGMVTVSLTKLDGTVMERTLEKPEYGGAITLVSVAPSEMWDPSGGPAGQGFDRIGAYNVWQTLTWADWWKGPAGTEELPYTGSYVPDQYFIGLLAESWEVPDPLTYIYHLREGVHFHDKPPANGREVTADDVVYCYERASRNLRGSYFHSPPDEIYAEDRYTVVIKLATPILEGNLCLNSAMFIYPPEIVDEETDSIDWEESIGTGPYMLTDYVPGSSATLTRNPDYWQYDPLFPENQLPYADEIVRLSVDDAATQLAALRTGQLDFHYVTLEDAENLKESNPELLYRKTLAGDAHIVILRSDLAPFSDLRVRRALNLAVNNQEILDDFYMGDAELINFPVTSDCTGVYMTYEELPESVQELYSYDPVKAKQLLAEAAADGVFEPNEQGGFDMTTLVTTYPGTEDEMLQIQAYWADIGVNTELYFPPAASAWAIIFERDFEAAMAAYGTPVTYKLCAGSFYGSGAFLAVHALDYQDPEWDTRTTEILECIDPEEQTQLLRELVIYDMEKAFVIDVPRPYQYVFWQPWLKGYYGAKSVGVIQSDYGMLWLCWIDEDLK